MTPPEGHSGQLEYIFIIRTPPTVMIYITQGSCYCYSSLSLVAGVAGDVAVPD
jgi:hypothetical protein